MKQACEARGVEAEDGNLRQVFLDIKGAGDKVHCVLPKACAQQAPPEINAYTDRSWVFPKPQWLGMGGAGVWWPRRGLQSNALSTAEIELGIEKVHESGICIYTKIGGFHGSSTRTELSAGILAISGSPAVHLGTGCQAFQVKAERILDDIRHGRRQRKPWKIQKDGDLWQHFYLRPRRKDPKPSALAKLEAMPRRSMLPRGLWTPKIRRAMTLRTVRLTLAPCRMAKTLSDRAFLSSGGTTIT